MWGWGADAAPYATWACVPTWLDDYAADLPRIDIPTLIVHGTADRILSIDGQGRRLHAALPDAKYVEIEGASESDVVKVREKLGLAGVAAVVPTYADLVSHHLSDRGHRETSLTFR